MYEHDELKQDVPFVSYMDAQRRFGELKWTIRSKAEGKVEMLVDGAVKDAFSAADLVSPPAKSAGAKKRKPASAAKDKAPKKPKAAKDGSDDVKKTNPYLMFCGERRQTLTAELKESDPEKGPKDVMRALAAEWKLISPEDKKDWQAKADAKTE